jgi:hypothetical protein
VRVPRGVWVDQAVGVRSRMGLMGLIGLMRSRTCVLSAIAQNDGAAHAVGESFSPLTFHFSPFTVRTSHDSSSLQSSSLLARLRCVH